MALLTEQQRIEIKDFMSRNEDCTGLTKPDIMAAVDAIDQWCEDNAASFNTALPQPFRGIAAPTQKALILALVAIRRANKLDKLGR